MDEAMIEDDWEYCREMLPKVSRTFALNIVQLEGLLFKAVLLGYLLFRIADTFEDTEYRDERQKIADLKDFSEIFTGNKSLDEHKLFHLRDKPLLIFNGFQIFQGLEGEAI